MRIQLPSLLSIFGVSLLVKECSSFTPLHVSDTQHVLRLDKTKLQGGIMDFLNEGKKALVKSLAGDYDASTIQQRIKSLIEENPVLMLSFTT